MPGEHQFASLRLTLVLALITAALYLYKQAQSERSSAPANQMEQLLRYQTVQSASPPLIFPTQAEAS